MKTTDDLDSWSSGRYNWARWPTQDRLIMGAPRKVAVRDRQDESKASASAEQGTTMSDAELLGIEARDLSSSLREVDAGFDFSSFTRLQKAMDLPKEERPGRGQI